MTPLLCPPHSILDFSIEKEEKDLRLIAYSIGEIADCIERKEADLILTELFRMFVDGRDFYWTQPEPQFALLRDISNKFEQFFLYQNEGIKTIDLSDIVTDIKHPILENTTSSGLVDLWAIEVQKLLIKHDAIDNSNFFIGIPCHKAFAGFEKGSFSNPNNVRCFPLIGPAEISNLSDSYEWVVPSDIHQKQISPIHIIRNCRSIGGTYEKPDGDSHGKIHFDAYTWTFSMNDDPVPDHYLQELEPHISLPLKVIKFSLLSGTLPQKRFRLR